MPSHLSPKKRSLRPTKDKLVGVRLTQSEYDFVKQEAESFGMTISDYLRPIILNKKMIPRTDASAIGELRRIGGLLKHIHNESKGAYRDLTASTLLDMQSCINEIKKGAISAECSPTAPENS